MQVSYELSADDYRHALLAYRNRSFLRRWKMPLMAAAFLPWAALQGYLTVVTDQSWLRWSLPLTLFTICLLLFEHWGAPYINARRQFRNTPSAHGAIALDVQDRGPHFRTADSDASVSWSRYVNWAEDDCVFVLFSSPWMFVIIPKRAFDAVQQTQFREMLRQRISVANNR
jgi:hypothetical protein